MNRRNFFKAVTGFVAGVCAALVPKVKAEEWTHVTVEYNGSDDIEIYPKRKQKFHTGDRVHVGDLPENMSHFRGENKDATIIMSYKDEFGGGLHNPPIYSLDIDGFGFNAWYPENLLTRIGVTYFLNTKSGNDNDNGLSPTKAFKTYDRIFDEVKNKSEYAIDFNITA